MQPRRANAGLWFIGLAGCSAVFICLCVAVAGGGLWLTSQSQVRQMLPALGGASAPAPVNRIAYTGIDGNIYTMAPDGSDARQITSDASPTQAPQLVYRFPTWSPDSRTVAFVGITRTGGESYQSKLYAGTVAAGPLETLHTAAGTGPFYLYWSPDSRSVAFLESAGESIALRLATLGQTESRELGQASPFYFDWSPDSQRLMWHTGGGSLADKTAMSLFRPNGGERSPLADNPGLFMAPDWSPDGQNLLYARVAAADEELVIADANGANPRSLLAFEGAVSFAWAPAGGKIAYIVTDSQTRASLGPIAFGPLSVMDATGENKKSLTDDNALGFFWSPDGGKIAYLTLADRNQGAAPADGVQMVAQGGQVRLNWHVVDLATGEKKSLGVFSPTPVFLSLIPYFDQYQRSLRVWSPDSRSLVYTVVEGASQAGVFVVDVAGGEPRRVADGIEAVWSWR